ncbi:MAG: GNAT family N-acetyltransferase [Bacteroidota bacterium]|nr:GNAT family N-acetyltransferase [Bacteroidota bacterium]
MIVRDYRPGDFPQIENLWKETGVYRSERGDTSETIERCNTQGGKFLVLEDEMNQRIIGTSWLTWDGRRVLMHHFAVLPSRQGSGYGRKLAVDSLEFALDKGVPLKLEVHRENIPAVQLYLKMGFKVLEGYEVYLLHHDS